MRTNFVITYISKLSMLAFLVIQIVHQTYVENMQILQSKINGDIQAWNKQ